MVDKKRNKFDISDKELDRIMGKKYTIDTDKRKTPYDEPPMTD